MFLTIYLFMHIFLNFHYFFPNKNCQVREFETKNIYWGQGGIQQFNSKKFTKLIVFNFKNEKKM